MSQDKTTNQEKQSQQISLQHRVELFGAVCLIGEIVFTLFDRNKKDKKK
ncbi:hypothetical protein [Helicobacter pylori]|nr:hypothetical protein [Helicobacter pylori]